MRSDPRQPSLARLTRATLVLAVLLSGALAPAAAARCQVGCGPSAAAAEADTCCAGHERPAPAKQPGTGHEEHAAGCCPVACQGCAARPLFAASGPALSPTAPPLAFAPVAHPAAVDMLDVAFSIFHPPKA